MCYSMLSLCCCFYNNMPDPSRKHILTCLLLHSFNVTHTTTLLQIHLCASLLHTLHPYTVPVRHMPVLSLAGSASCCDCAGVSVRPV